MHKTSHTTKRLRRGSGWVLVTSEATRDTNVALGNLGIPRTFGAFQEPFRLSSLDSCPYWVPSSRPHWIVVLSGLPNISHMGLPQGEGEGQGQRERERRVEEKELISMARASTSAGVDKWASRGPCVDTTLVFRLLSTPRHFLRLMHERTHRRFERLGVYDSRYYSAKLVRNTPPGLLIDFPKGRLGTTQNDDPHWIKQFC